MWPKYYLRYVAVMFPYGMYRQWRADIQPPYDLYGYRFAGSVLSGCYYSTPYGVLQIFSLMNRVNIHYEGRDPSVYPQPYNEIFGLNPHVL